MTESTEQLTYFERSCLQSVARGLPPKTGADLPGNDQDISIQHLASARKKLMAATSVEAVARALKLGLIE